MAFCGQCGTKSNGGSFCTECGAALASGTASSRRASAPTTFANRCDILAELWVSYKRDPEFSDFFEYNDLGLPLAYAVSSGIVETNSKIEISVNETFQLLLNGLSIEDAAFESLSELLDLEDEDEE